MRRLLFALFGLLVLFSAREASAQIVLDLEMDRSLFLSHEPITGTLTIVNRAGKDLIFGDSAGGLSWLDFTVTDNRGHLITPTQNRIQEKPIVLSAGQTYKHKVTINRYYPMATLGNYRVKANVTFPQINRVFTTKTVTIQVTEGQLMWNQIVGVPQGHPQAGSTREYSLMTYYHGARAKALYFRLKDSNSGMVFTTFTIGDYMTVIKPTYAIDTQNQLHVLHMSGPKRYKYTVINIDGKPVKQATYWEKGSNRPTLKTSDFGDVSIVGGLTEEEMQTPYEETEFRPLSERPPGMPAL
ncbi:MAG: hypothetical protein P1U86_08385 [Verrucomicrobiales bacterium]|nr:hypothetical protein [Verrucomicrobiales bacterium]